MKLLIGMYFFAKIVHCTCREAVTTEQFLTGNSNEEIWLDNEGCFW